jgi:predicted fused transcriptional regulator/phosphomethylpyrimidine kinase
MAIEELLRQKKQVYAQDLPFNLKYAEEYLKLFYSQKYLEFSFDRENKSLMKKA